MPAGSRKGFLTTAAVAIANISSSTEKTARLLPPIRNGVTLINFTSPAPIFRNSQNGKSARNNARPPNALMPISNHE